MERKLIEQEFIRNIAEVKVDGLKGVNHYAIYKAFDFIYVDNNGTHAEYKQIKIDEFDYTWAEIEADGGIAEINKQFKEEYGENCLD